MTKYGHFRLFTRPSTLDADIYTKNAVTGKKRKYKSQKDMWHHTKIEKDEEGNFIYHFAFKRLDLGVFVESSG